MRALHGLCPADQLDRGVGIFEPPVEVPDDASLLDRTVAFSGRDPGWSTGGLTVYIGH